MLSVSQSVSLDDVAVDDGVSGQEPVLEVILAEHRREVVPAQILKGSNISHSYTYGALSW